MDNGLTVVAEYSGQDEVGLWRIRFVTSPLLIDAGRRIGKTAMLSALERDAEQAVRAQRAPGRRTVVAMAVDELLS